MRKLAIVFLVSTSAAFSQDASPDRVTVPFSDASRPKSLKASLINGSITVRGYDGKDAIVEAVNGSGRPRRAERERSDGLRRIDIGGTGLAVEEADNVVTVGTRSVNENISLSIQVPFNTSLKLHAVNGGNIIVDHITGDVEIDNTNGNATVTHISGAAIVHALNGKVLVSFDKIAGDKPMSFSSLNGRIDVTFPADTKARLRLKTTNGSIFSDFDVKMEPDTTKPVVEDTRGRDGRYRIRLDRSAGVYGSINGGGPEYSFQTMNSTILIHKK